VHLKVKQTGMPPQPKQSWAVPISRCALGGAVAVGRKRDLATPNGLKRRDEHNIVSHFPTLSFSMR
jgi:hypothetical protein